MKIVFSTKNVSRASFLDICRYAYDYGFEGFERNAANLVNSVIAYFLEKEQGKND